MSRAARVIVGGDLVYNKQTDILSITELEVFDEAEHLLEPEIVFTCTEHLLTAESAEGRRGFQKAHPLRASAYAAVRLNEYEPDWSSDWRQTTLGARHAEVMAHPWDPQDWQDPRFAAIEYAQSKLPVPPRRDDSAVQAPTPRRFPAVYVPEGA